MAFTGVIYTNKDFPTANMSSSEDEQLNEEVSGSESDSGTDNENDDNQNRVSKMFAWWARFLNYRANFICKNS